MRNRLIASIFAALFAPAALAQEPLSIIDWLGQEPTPARPLAVPHRHLDSQILVTPLPALAQTQIGLAPPDVTGLGLGIWQSRSAPEYEKLLLELPALELPAAQSLLFTLLLAEAQSPPAATGFEDTFTLARIDTLARYGALEPVLALLEAAGPTRSPDRFARYIDMSLLVGTEDHACGLLLDMPHLAPSDAHYVFCAARAGDWRAADVIFSAARALGQTNDTMAGLLERFLHPDAWDGNAALPELSPLVFRLLEAVGEPIPTSTLPRTYAVADLRDIAGWKSQLDAAERLARAGALPDNRLLGLYTERLAAASGGVWDRVRALQHFETALNIGALPNIENTLPAVWAAMQDARLEVPFATLFVQDISEIANELNGEPARIATQIALLSPHYADAAGNGMSPVEDFALAVARGGALVPTDPLTAAIKTGFETQTPKITGDVGGQTLVAIQYIQAGAKGDSNALSRGLGMLIALGFDDAARRAALQVLLLERDGS